MKRKAKIIYNEEYDSFDIQILTEEGWGLDQRYKCVTKEGGGNPVFIHFGILRKIADLDWQGYEVKVLE